MIKCPKCGSTDYETLDEDKDLNNGWMILFYGCLECPCLFEINCTITINSIVVEN